MWEWIWFRFLTRNISDQPPVTAAAVPTESFGKYRYNFYFKDDLFHIQIFIFKNISIISQLYSLFVFQNRFSFIFQFFVHVSRHVFKGCQLAMTVFFFKNNASVVSYGHGDSGVKRRLWTKFFVLRSIHHHIVVKHIFHFSQTQYLHEPCLWSGAWRTII